MNAQSTLRHPVLHAMAGLGVWALAFVVLYGGLSVACRTPLVDMRFGPVNAVSLVLVGLWLAHLGWLSLMTLRAWRSRHQTGEASSVFMRRLTLFLNGTSWLALLALGAPILFLTPCI